MNKKYPKKTLSSNMISNGRFYSYSASYNNNIIMSLGFVTKLTILQSLTKSCTAVGVPTRLKKLKNYVIICTL